LFTTKPRDAEAKALINEAKTLRPSISRKTLGTLRNLKLPIQ
jgi:hypothetical protein